MATLVKKFGGSSVATPEKMHGIVDRILRERQPDDRIVLVVSAMGDHTDDLLTLAAKVNPEMPKRELDMLLATGEQVSIALMASAFCAKGQPAVSFTDTWISGINTIHVSIDIAHISFQTCRNRNSSSIAAAAAQSCDLSQVSNALEPGNDNYLAFVQSLLDLTGLYV